MPDIGSEQLDRILSLVGHANQAALDIYGKDFEVQYKSPGDPLTEADLEVDRIIASGLSDLFPDTPIVSEEADESENLEIIRDAKSFFLLDPIDGTREFVKKTGDFCICLALVDGEEPVFGIVSAPARDQLFYGGQSVDPMMIGDEGPTELAVSEYDVMKVLVSRGNRDSDDYVREHYPQHEHLVVGSQLKLPYIAAGWADAYPRLKSPLHSWDLAAGHAILEAAGGSVTAIDGSPINYRREDFKVGDFIASR